MYRKTAWLHTAVMLTGMSCWLYKPCTPCTTAENAVPYTAHVLLAELYADVVESGYGKQHPGVRIRPPRMA